MKKVLVSDLDKLEEIWKDLLEKRSFPLRHKISLDDIEINQGWCEFLESKGIEVPFPKTPGAWGAIWNKHWKRVKELLKKNNSEIIDKEIEIGRLCSKKFVFYLTETQRRIEKLKE